MDYKYIEQLLDRYFEGETTLHEEQILRTFYGQAPADLPQELSRYAALFAALDGGERLGSDFDERILAMTGQDSPARGDSSADDAPVKARVVSLAERLRPLFGAAATVAILLTLGLAINQSFRQDDTWVDAEEYAQRGLEVATGEPAVAYEQTKDSLTLPGEGPAGVLMPDSLLGVGIR